MTKNDAGLQALARLREGNRRFASNVRSVDSLLSQLRRSELAQKQEPHAIILCCSDSRSPAEIVFDQGLGDLFVIRVAGNIVAPSQIGSIEFAADAFHTRLVVVMGHTGCGAIEAAIDASKAHVEASKNLLSIVDRVRPSVEQLLAADPSLERKTLARAAVRANVKASAEQLRQAPMLEGLVKNDALLVVGAVYDMASGEVDFFDGNPTL